MQVEVILRGRIRVTQEYPGEQFSVEDCLEKVFEDITDDLYNQKADEPSVAGSMSNGEIEISVLVTATSRGAALDKGEAIIRAALSAADVWTDGWERDKAHMLRAEICEVAAAELVAA